ncbi:MAG: DEAD/DEAH box helicase [Candidatus Bilamarchaeaceae archaeon]
MKFEDMGLSQQTLRALHEMNYQEATEIQEKAIPMVLQGEEVVVRSQTGTGKTAAFGIGLIETIAADKRKKALVLAPTRELALQIAKELKAISTHHRLIVLAIYGGQDMDRQFDLLKRGYDIIVATPGRLLDHARRGTLQLSNINLVVLDEADRMLDMGFKDEMDQILDEVSPNRHMMMFSATIDQMIRDIAANYMKRPEYIEVGSAGKVETIDEEFITLARREKIHRLKEIMKREPMSRTIIFVSTQRGVEFVCRNLNDEGIRAQYLHGGKTQNQRERAVRDFKEGKFNVLVATDVASRGIHIDDISHIISYDKADSLDTHTHRIGRTGRMGKSGKAITFVETDPLPPRDYSKMRRSGGFGNRDRRGGSGRNEGRGGPRREGHGRYGDHRGPKREGGYGRREESHRRNEGHNHGSSSRPRSRWRRLG